MRKLSCILLFITVFSFISKESFAQSKPQKLTPQIFKDSIQTHSWWVLDTITNAMVSMQITKDSCTIAYINLAEGIAVNSCTYDLSIKNNFFKITFKSCEGVKGNGKIVYGYLAADRKIKIMSSKTELSMNDQLLTSKDWITLEILEEK